MKSRARSNRSWMTTPLRVGAPKWKRRKGSYIKGRPWGSKSKYNRTQANRRTRRQPIETED